MIFIKKKRAAGGVTPGFGTPLATAFTYDAVSITNPTTVTGSMVVAVGDLVVVHVSEQTGITSTAVTDNLGNTYVSAAGTADAGNATGILFYSYITNAGTLTQVDVAATASGRNVTVLVAGFAGLFQASPLDADPTGIADDLSSPYTAPATGTLAQADELIITWFVQNGSVTISASSPNAIAVQENTSTVHTAAMGYQIVTATTSVAPEFTSTATPTDSALGTATFKAQV